MLYYIFIFFLFFVKGDFDCSHSLRRFDTILIFFNKAFPIRIFFNFFLYYLYFAFVFFFFVRQRDPRRVNNEEPITVFASPFGQPFSSSAIRLEFIFILIFIQHIYIYIYVFIIYICMYVHLLSNLLFILFLFFFKYVIFFFF